MKAVLRSFDPQRPGWNHAFEKPRAVRIAHKKEDVVPVLRWLEEETRGGRWGVVLVSYESAAALNPLLPSPLPSPFPKVWAAVFDRPVPPRPDPARPWEVSSWRPGVSEAVYRRGIDAVKRWIARGDTYQVNYTFPLTAKFQGDPRSWFWSLGRAQGAAYSAWVDLGRWKVMSFSPELFLERQGGRLLLRPMKGSAPRGRWPEEDRPRVRALQSSAKDRAENVMIVDLLRNDAGQIARPGGVRTRRLFRVETYPTVHQMTSEVTARLRPGVGLVETLGVLFPSGSVTGAPKRRTMEILRSLEKRPRGLYTGAVGLLEPSGRWTFNVAIRTVVLDTSTGRAQCAVGGGVTWASTAEGERREALWKARFLDRAEDFSLLESLRLENGEFPFLVGHRRRLGRSAAYFGFPFPWPKILKALKGGAARHPHGLWKARLTLSREGNVEVTAEALPLEDRAWRVKFAPHPVDDQDVFLFHKTTRRGVYDRARESAAGVEDVLLWNARGELTESTRGNLVVEKNGRRYTPPRSSGLLAGVFRERLLRGGKIEEKVLRPRDLRTADKIFLINAVRGWIPVELKKNRSSL